MPVDERVEGRDPRRGQPGLGRARESDGEADDEGIEEERDDARVEAPEDGTATRGGTAASRGACPAGTRGGAGSGCPRARPRSSTPAPGARGSCSSSRRRRGSRRRGSCRSRAAAARRPPSWPYGRSAPRPSPMKAALGSTTRSVAATAITTARVAGRARGSGEQAVGEGEERARAARRSATGSRSRTPVGAGTKGPSQAAAAARARVVREPPRQDARRVVEGEVACQRAGAGRGRPRRLCRGAGALLRRRFRRSERRARAPRRSTPGCAPPTRSSAGARRPGTRCSARPRSGPPCGPPARGWPPGQVDPTAGSRGPRPAAYALRFTRVKGASSVHALYSRRSSLPRRSRREATHSSTAE